MTLRSTMNLGAPTPGAGAITLDAGSFASPPATPAHVNFDGIFLDDWWDATASDPIVRVLSGTPFVDDDRNMLSNTQGKTDYAITVERRGAAAMPTFFSSNEAVATVSAAGFVTHFEDGTATITVQSALRTMTFPLSFVTTSTGDQYVNGVTGSLRRHIEDAFSAAIVGKTEADVFIFTTGNWQENPVAVRNTTCWAAAFNLTCDSPFNTGGGTQIGGTAITPRHILMVGHWSVDPGAVFTFVGPDNTIYTRTLADRVGVGVDLSVGRLDSDLPAGITPAKFFPEGEEAFAAKMPLTRTWGTAPFQYLDYGQFVPLLFINQDRRAAYREAVSVLGRIEYLGSLSGYNAGSNVYPTAVTKLALSYFIRPGDSGSPLLTFVNGTPVLIAVIKSGGGESCAMNTTEINAAIDTMGSAGGHHVGTVDLSGFTSY